MSFASLIGQKLAKRISPIERTEVLDGPDLAFPSNEIIGFRSALSFDSIYSSNLLFSIPQISSNQAEFQFEASGISDLNVSLEVTDLEELVDLPLSEDDFVYHDKVIFSQNRFRPLGRELVLGKDYQRNRNSDQNLLFGPGGNAKGEFRKAHGRGSISGSRSSHISNGLSIWDLIYPVLLPPLDENFEEQFELHKELFKFQPTGIEFLVQNESALLADEMGTGKTVMTSVALKLLFRLGKVRKALIICPLSLLRTWQDHLTDWASELEVTVVRGSKESRKLDWGFPAHVYITTYDTIASDYLSKIKKHSSFNCPGCGRGVRLGDHIVVEDDELPTYYCRSCDFELNEFVLNTLPQTSSIVDANFAESFDVVVLDEAQYIKNPSSQRSRAVRLFDPKYRWALSGTPIENRIEDLISIFKFVRPSTFGKERWVAPSRAKKMIEPYFLRRMKKDVMKFLPPKVEQEIWLELNSDQRKAYDAAEKAGIAEIEGLEQVTKVHIFALITKLKQICNFLPNTSSSSKLEELFDLVDQIKSNGQKVLVFSQYDVEGISKLEPLLQKYGVVVMKGSMSAEARNRSIANFKSDPNICVFLAAVKTAGVGLTLTEASYVIHFDHWWNPAIKAQASDRVHRKGQSASQVNIYSFWIQNTIEQRIHAILKEKNLLIDEVINGLSQSEVDGMISTDEWLSVLGINQKK